MKKEGFPKGFFRKTAENLGRFKTHLYPYIKKQAVEACFSICRLAFEGFGPFKILTNLLGRSRREKGYNHDKRTRDQESGQKFIDGKHTAHGIEQ